MTTVWAGLATGALYSLVAIGYNVVLLTSGVFNFANAQLVMLSTFVAYLGLHTLGLPVPIAMLLGAVAVAAVAMVLERVAVRPLLTKSGDGHGTLITTIGFGVLVAGLVKLIWGTDPLRVEPVVSGDPVSILGGTVQPNDLVLIVLVLAMGCGLHWWSRTTRHGLASLASAENRNAAMLRGINTRGLGVAAFAVAGAAAGLLGIFVATRTYAIASLGDGLAMFGFVAIAIGGAGSQLGGLLGGFTVGLIYSFSARYLGSEYPQIAVFFLFLLILLVRPQGLFTRTVERAV
ncbi:branched-chain amino acid ABC transporter permease [Kribbella solani]|uniref:Branched-chain amino acid transport system permease protein n=1 Tax=Kribbella solani TaxID=236067 RepID=A0A841DJS2_9ACTN|nr:branched-chain amino acid ABC transporter permease [Kribbella solani]MBB5977325.1 branched-chain amino acid transport system permease protein [Kribbella solani]